MPLGGLLKGIASAQHARFIPCARNDLQADRQTFCCKSAGHGKCGQAAQVEGRSKASQLAGAFDGVFSLQQRCGDGCGGEQERIVFIEQ